MTTASADVVVVGGGIAGLVAAATATRAGASVTLLERVAGAGRASTDERSGFKLNRGGHALYRGGEAEAVFERLGVVAAGTAPPTKGATALVEGRLELLPVGGSSLLRSGVIGVKDKARLASFLGRLPKVDPASVAGLSVDGWIADVGVSDRGADLIRALVRLTTYVAAPELMDAGAALVQLQASITRGVRYLDGGWGRLAASVSAAAVAAGATIERAAASSVEPAPGGVEVRLGDGRTLAARAVVLATGTPTVTAALLPGGAPGAFATAGPEAAASCLDMGLVRQPDVRFVVGIDRPVYSSVHHPPADLAPEGGSVLHLMRYLHPASSVDAATTRAELAALAAKVGVAAGDIAVERYLHRMVVTGGMPTVEHGGLAGRPGVEVPGHPGVLVAGDWVGPTGQLVDAAAVSGETAGAAAARLASRAPVRTR